MTNSKSYSWVEAQVWLTPELKFLLTVLCCLISDGIESVSRFDYLCVGSWARHVPLEAIYKMQSKEGSHIMFCPN